MSPLLVKVSPWQVQIYHARFFMTTQAIINFTKEREALKARGEKAPSVGRGIGMAIGLFCLIILTSLLQHQVRVLSWALMHSHVFSSFGALCLRVSYQGPPSQARFTSAGLD
jgi:hypothetical protein